MDPALKKQEICPDSYPSPLGYIFENTDSWGHKFFQKIAPEWKPSNHQIMFKRKLRVFAFQEQNHFSVVENNLWES